MLESDKTSPPDFAAPQPGSRPGPEPLRGRESTLSGEPGAVLAAGGAVVAEADLPIRQRIVECAGAMFAERGYRDTTVRDIAAAANVNLAGISYHFGGKQQLYLATIDAAQQSRIDFSALAGGVQRGTPEERLRQFVRALLGRLVDRGERDWRSRLLARELTSPTDFCFEQISRWYRPIFEVLLRMVEEVVGTPLPEPRRTLVGFSLVGQCLFYRVSAETVRFFVPPERRATFADVLDVPALADHICDLTLRGLNAAAGPEQRKT